MDCLTLEYGTDCPETSVGNCYSSLRKIQIECICYGKSLLKSLPLLRGGVFFCGNASLKKETDPAPDA